ncbi:hypothetical protein Bpfe_027827 [Biomphalaria pfeifferi]|uniref:SMB domain-containing protein n=1 Tax=Biomphalaria pfeifferi TaxID=112525 RepID=A0AAD8AUN1_BIOPF|nr:hypothetical protein Bpfe_027827 [Biomphalaria pfeifferi]
MSVTSSAVLFFVGFVSFATCSLDPNRPIDDQCLGVCGQVFSMPCSCASTCVLYKNCCENMANHCPHIVEEGQMLYARQLTSEIVCEEYGYFVITSCPANFSNSSFEDSAVHAESQTTEATTLLSATSVNVNVSNGSPILFRLAELFAARPVQDTITGLLYKDMDTFYCNTLRDSNFTLWKVFIVSDHHEIMTKVSEILNYLTKSPVVYMPPYEFVDKEEGNVCFNEAISQCKIKMELQHMCDSFISYVTHNNTYYRNKYCFKCNIVQNLTFKPVYAFKMSRFAFSLTFEVSDKDKYDIKYVEAPGYHDKLIWKSVTCRVEDDPALSRDVGCEFTKCAPPRVLRYDRECWTVKRIEIGVGSEVLLKSKEEEDIYSKYFACAFETIFRHDVVSTTKPSYAFYPGSKRYIISSTIFFYVKDMNVFKQSPNLLLNIAIIGRTFAKYKNVLFRKSESRDPDFQVDFKHKMFVSAKITDSAYFKKMLQKGPFETTLTVCYFFEDSSDQVTCWEEPIYLSNYELPNNISKTSCFHALSRAADIVISSYIQLAIVVVEVLLDLNKKI